MGKPININSKGEIVDLKAAKYKIYSLGGFGVNLNQFSISLKHTETSESIKCKQAFWPVQAFAFGKRAKRILIVDIPKEGRYEVLFHNPETLRIKHSNLPISSMFGRPLATDKIEILITEKLGIFSFLKL